MKDVAILVQKSLDLVAELETYIYYRQRFLKITDEIFNTYQRGKLTYFQYEKEINKILKGRSKKAWVDYYDSYIDSLLKRIERYNSQIFYEAYNDISCTRLGEGYLHSRTEKQIKQHKESINKESINKESINKESIKPKHAIKSKQQFHDVRGFGNQTGIEKLSSKGQQTRAIEVRTKKPLAIQSNEKNLSQIPEYELQKRSKQTFLRSRK